MATAAAALGDAGFDWDECMILLDFEEFVEALIPAFFAEDSFAAGPARFLLDQLIVPSIRRGRSESSPLLDDVRLERQGSDNTV